MDRASAGPQGFRDNAHPGTTTCWPSGLTVGATWDPSAVRAWGAAMGKEVRPPLHTSRNLVEDKGGGEEEGEKGKVCVCVCVEGVWKGEVTVHSK